MFLPPQCPPPQLVDETPPAPNFSVLYRCLMFFIVNLHFAHVYTPLSFFYTPPPQFQIPRNNPGAGTYTVVVLAFIKYFSL